MSNALIIPFPSVSGKKGISIISVGEMIKAYDIIMKAFMYKFQYETAKYDQKPINEQYNLGDIRSYNYFVNTINNNINDPILRQFILKLNPNAITKSIIKYIKAEKTENNPNFMGHSNIL